MTERHTFEIELVTSDEVDQRRARKTVAQFLDRLTKTDPFVSTKLTPVDTTVQRGLSENEKNRLIKALDGLSSEECAAAVEIAEGLSKTNE
jgi:hypothetical protein